MKNAVIAPRIAMISTSSVRTRLGTWKAIVNALNAPDVAKYDDATISRTSPAMRDRPVAALKMAVLRAMPPAPGGAPCVGCSGSSPAAGGAVVSAATGALSYGAPRACPRGLCASMANIPSQKKRILRAERERLENRRYTSTVKTYFRRLAAAVEAGDDAKADADHRELVSLIDKAVKTGALHRNNGARKKSRAARLRRGEPSA